MSLDPKAEEYASFSPYNHVLGDPINMMDPDGRWPTKAKAAANVVGSFIVGFSVAVTTNINPLERNVASTRRSVAANSASPTANIVGQYVGDAVTMVAGAVETAAGLTTIAASGIFGGGATLATAGAAAPVAVPVSAGGIALGAAATAQGSFFAANAANNFGSGSGGSNSGSTGGQPKKTGKAKNKLKPDPDATGDHTSIKRNTDGEITNYATYERNPRQPETGYSQKQRTDLVGQPDYGVKTPHTHMEGIKKPVPTPSANIPKTAAKK